MLYLVSSIIFSHHFQNVLLVPRGEKKLAREKHQMFAVAEGDHLTLLNGKLTMKFYQKLLIFAFTKPLFHKIVYNEFIRCGQSERWCRTNFIDYNAITQACSIRKQIEFLVNSKLNEIITSDQQKNVLPKLDEASMVLAVKKCLINSFFMNSATLQADGSYRSLRNDMVRMELSFCQF